MDTWHPLCQEFQTFRIFVGKGEVALCRWPTTIGDGHTDPQAAHQARGHLGAEDRDHRPGLRRGLCGPIFGTILLAPKMGACYGWTVQAKMRVIARNTLRAFWERYPAAEGSLKAWFSEATRANWQTMADIKRRYATASIIDDERVVFNLGGNKFRLVVKVWFPGRAIWIKFIGTHASYDQIDVRKL